MKKLLIMLTLLLCFSCQKASTIDGTGIVIPEKSAPGWSKPVSGRTSTRTSSSPTRVENKRFVDKVLGFIEEEQYKQARKSPSAVESVRKDIQSLRSSSVLKRIDDDAGKIIDAAAYSYSKNIGVTFGDTISINVLKKY